MTTAEIVSRFSDAKQKGNSWQCTCPSHDDHQASLNIAPGDNPGYTVLKCYAGCSAESILAAVGLKISDLMPDREQSDKWEEVPKTFQKSHQFTYTDESGNLLFTVIRGSVKERNQRTGEERTNPKKFLQCRPDGNGRTAWNLKGVRRVLYRLPEVLKAIEGGNRVFVVEGEKDVETLRRFGLVATTNAGGAAEWKPSFSESLAGAHLVIFPDNDEPGRKHAERVARETAGKAASVRVIELPGLPPKGDVSDWLGAGRKVEQLLALVDTCPEWKPTPSPKTSSDDSEESSGRGPSVADRLVNMARERYDLWHTPEGIAYASIPYNGHMETWPVESTGMRDHLSRAYYVESGKAIAPTAMQSAVSMIGTFARIEGKTREVYTRKADTISSDGAIWVDLCNDQWQAVKVTAEGWEVVDNPPVAFRRAKGMLPLPIPSPGGNLADLRNFVNSPNEGEGVDIFVMMIAWLLAALGPHRPYPILNLLGEQGTAKSSTARFLRSLVDPSNTPLRREPKEDRDLAIAAKNAFVVCFDNLSGVPVWLSDTLCCLSTGGGFGTRKLHSDDDETLFSFLSPVILTGIGEPSTRGDFLQRSLLLSLPTISDDRRKAEADVLPAFEEARPALFGALLSAVSTGLRRLPETHLPESPRMADFARWVVACEPACPWKEGDFLEAYRDNQAAGGDVALEADKIAPLVQSLMCNRLEWDGTSADLLEALRGISDDRQKAELPKNPRSLSVALKRIAPALRSEKSITIEGPVVNSKGKRILTVKKSTEKQEGYFANTSQNHFANTDSEPFAKYPKGSPASQSSEGTSQTSETAQNTPYFSSINPRKKNKEEGESNSANSEVYNTGNFAKFATSEVGDYPEGFRDEDLEDPFDE